MCAEAYAKETHGVTGQNAAQKDEESQALHETRAHGGIDLQVEPSSHH